MRQLLNEEKNQSFQRKKELGSYQKQAINKIDEQRRQQFEQKKNDHTNLEQSLTLQQETAQRIRELQEADYHNKLEVFDTLAH